MSTGTKCRCNNEMSKKKSNEMLGGSQSVAAGPDLHKRQLRLGQPH